MNIDEFLNMAEVYKKAPCPVCRSQVLKYNGYRFQDGEMAGQLEMTCFVCEKSFDLHVHSLRNTDLIH